MQLRLDTFLSENIVLHRKHYLIILLVFIFDDSTKNVITPEL